MQTDVWNSDDVLQINKVHPSAPLINHGFLVNHSMLSDGIQDAPDSVVLGCSLKLCLDKMTHWSLSSSHKKVPI